MRDGLVFFLFIQEFKYPLRRRRGGLQHIGHLSHLGDRLVEAAHILDKDWMSPTSMVFLTASQPPRIETIT